MIPTQQCGCRRRGVKHVSNDMYMRHQAMAQHPTAAWCLMYLYNAADNRHTFSCLCFCSRFRAWQIGVAAFSVGNVANFLSFGEQGPSFLVAMCSRLHVNIGAGSSSGSSRRRCRSSSNSNDVRHGLHCGHGLFLGRPHYTGSPIGRCGSSISSRGCTFIMLQAPGCAANDLMATAGTNTAAAAT